MPRSLLAATPRSLLATTPTPTPAVPPAHSHLVLFLLPFSPRPLHPCLAPPTPPARSGAHFLLRLYSSSSRTDPAAVAATKAQEAMAARMEAYKKVQEFDWSSGADWKTAVNILFTVPPKRKEFGLDFHLVQLFFVCMPSLAVYLVAQYARREIKRMEAEAEEKRKRKEELEKQKQLEADSVKEDADSELATLLVRLDTLEGVVKEITDGKMRSPSLDLSTSKEALKKGETSSPDKAPATKSDTSDSQPASVKSKDINSATNVLQNMTQQDSGERQDNRGVK